MPEAAELQELLDEWLRRTTFPVRGSTLRCGVSGGADSLALLALAVAAGCDVTAVHVDHGQRPSGGNEAAVVAQACGQVGAEFMSTSVDVPAGPNLEARMRAARYGVLGPEAATGHTADDQAETMIINLLRGAGLRGLGAMTPGPRRPILALRRTETIEICRRLEWDWFEDPSNRDPSFQRNRVRHEVLPLFDDIAARDVTPLLVRSAEHARVAAAELSAQASRLDPTDAKVLAAAPRPIAALALQDWVRDVAGSEHPIDAAAIARLLDVVAGRSVAAEVSGGWRISRSAQRLSLTAPSNQP